MTQGKISDISTHRALKKRQLETDKERRIKRLQMERKQ